MRLRDFQALELITPPATVPVSLPEMKDHLALDGTDHDALITGIISAATKYVDGLGVLGSAMVTQTWGQWTGPSPDEVLLKILPVQSLTAVKYYDTDGVLQSATLADFELQQAGEWAMVKPVSGKTWPATDSRAAAIKLEYDAGFGDAADVPEDIKQAIMMLAAHWFENRESSSEVRLASTPFGFTEILSARRSVWYG